MPTSQMSEVIQQLRSALLRERPDLTDGQLLEGFVSRRDTAALEALVLRHGLMVWGVCRRVLRNHQDAEDAFQATFLVLVRKAASITPRAKVGNWLYGVAHQTALKARATRTKRQVREQQVTEMPEAAVMGQDLWEDVQPLLDQEVSQLPEKYRTVIVLCDLEGRTKKEVARQLGLPEGTVASRVARARTMLAKRLARHGLAVSGGTLGAVLFHKAASASVPPSILSSTIQAVTSVAAGQAAAAGPVSGKVAALTEGVLKAMMMSKLKAVVAVVLVLGFIVTGATALCYRMASAQSDKTPIAEKPMEPVAKQEKEGFTAWGKEAGGLQAGLGYLPGQHRAYHLGETVTLVVRVRNVCKEAVKFQYLRQFFIERPPAVTDDKGNSVSLTSVSYAGGGHFPVEVTLAPGKEIELYELMLKLRPASDGKDRFSTVYGTGKFSIQYERVLGNSSSGFIKLDPALSKLATGKLELEVKADPPKENDPKDDKDDAQTSLSSAIKALNRKALNDSIGKEETPITEQEVIAAIRAAKRPKDSAVTDKLFDAFKKIAETKQLPPGAELEAVGGIWDPGTAFIYDVWWVRVRMPKEADGTYGFAIRERIIRSRTLQEELVRIEKERPIPPEVDGGRTQERINALKARIEKMKTN